MGSIDTKTLVAGGLRDHGEYVDLEVDLGLRQTLNDDTGDGRVHVLQVPGEDRIDALAVGRIG